jgi:hypothetical protein
MHDSLKEMGISARKIVVSIIVRQAESLSRIATRSSQMIWCGNHSVDWARNLLSYGQLPVGYVYVLALPPDIHTIRQSGGIQDDS